MSSGPTDDQGGDGTSSDGDEGVSATDTRQSSGGPGQWLLPAVVRERLLARVILGLLVVIVLNATIAGFFYLTIDDNLDRQVDRQVEATTTVHANVYDLWFERRLDETEALAQQQFAGLDDDETSAVLRDARIRNEQVRHYHYVSVDTGRIEASSNPAAVGENLLDRGIDSDTLDRQEFVLSEPFSTVENDPAIGIGTGVPFVRYVVVAEIDAEAATPTLEQPVRGATTNVVTADATLVGNVSGSPPTRTDGGVTVTSTNGDIVAYHPLRSIDSGYVVTRTPRESAFSIQNAVLQSFLVTIVLTFLTLVAATLVGGRSTLSDIRTLATRAESMGRGNLDSPLETAREDEIGTLYVQFDGMRRRLRDRIQQTERLNYQLQVTDRMLRHNLTNDMNVIQLTAEMIHDGVADDPAQEAAVIIEKCDRLLAKTDKQREITSILSTEQSREPIDVVTELREVIQSVQADYPAATVRLDAPDEATALVTSQLARAFRELLENGIVHSDRDEPTVTVRVTETDSTVHLEFEDDGPGIPDIERPVLLGEADIDQLNHGSGIGLWLVYWIVDQSGGDLDYEQTDDGGVVHIKLPSA